MVLGAVEQYKQSAEAFKNGIVKVCGIVLSAEGCETQAVSLDDEQTKVITDAMIKYYEEKAKGE